MVLKVLGRDTGGNLGRGVSNSGISSRTCYHKLCSRALLDLCLGGQGDSPTEVDATVIAPCGEDVHVEVMPIGQLCDLEAVVPDRLAETVAEGSLFFSLVAGAQTVPVQHKVLGPVGETAGEGGICSL